ncbi:hypothetical protein ES708_18525 [subsurface metagenome]
MPAPGGIEDIRGQHDIRHLPLQRDSPAREGEGRRFDIMPVFFQRVIGEKLPQGRQGHIRVKLLLRPIARVGQGQVEGPLRTATEGDPHDPGPHRLIRGQLQIEGKPAGSAQIIKNRGKLLSIGDQAVIRLLLFLLLPFLPQPRGEAGKLELPEDPLQGLHIGLSETEVLKIEVHRDVRPDGDQVSAHPRLIGKFCQFFTQALPLDLSGILQDAFERTELFHQLEGRLFTHAGDPGDVIRCIPREPQDIDHLVGPHAETTPDPLDVIGDVLHRIHHQDIVRHELHQVLVAGGDDHPHPRRLVPLRQGADDIVRLDPLLFDDLDGKPADDIPDGGDLGAKVVGHRAAVRLVLIVRLVPEGGTLRVKRDGDVLRRPVAAQLHEHVGKTVDRVGGKPPGGGKPADRVKRPVDIIRSVYEKHRGL